MPRKKYFTDIPYWEQAEAISNAIAEKPPNWKRVTVIAVCLIIMTLLNELINKPQKDNISQAQTVSVKNIQETNINECQTAKKSVIPAANTCASSNNFAETIGGWNHSFYSYLKKAGNTDFYMPNLSNPHTKEFPYPEFTYNDLFLPANFKKIQLVTIAVPSDPTSTASATLYVSLVDTTDGQVIFRIFVPQPGDKSIGVDVYPGGPIGSLQSLKRTMLPEKIDQQLDTTLTIMPKYVDENIATYSATLRYIGATSQNEQVVPFDIPVHLPTTQLTFKVYMFNFGTDLYGSMIDPLNYIICN